MVISCFGSVIVKQSAKKLIERFIKKSIKSSVFRGSLFLGCLALLMGCHNSLMMGGRAEQLEVEENTGSTGSTNPTNPTKPRYRPTRPNKPPVDVQTPPAAPADVKARAEDRKVTLSWSASAKATSYTIYREDKPGGAFTNPFESVKADKQVGGGKTYTYVDSAVVNGEPYYYKVRASSPVGDSAQSPVVPARPLSRPSITSVKASDRPVAGAGSGSGVLKVSWTESVGALRYEVLLTSKKSEVMAQSIERSTGKPPEGGAPSYVVRGLTERSYFANDLTPGVTYSVVVRAINTESGQMDSAAVEGTPREAPTLDLKTGDGQITATFASPGATSFLLYYGEQPAKYDQPPQYNEPRRYYDDGKLIELTNTNSFSVQLKNWRVYYFIVEANFPGGGILSSKQEHDMPGEKPGPFEITSATPVPTGKGDVTVNLVWGTSHGAISYTVNYGRRPGNYIKYRETTEKTTSTEWTGLGAASCFMVEAVNRYGSQKTREVCTLVCPPDYIQVPALAGYTTQEFCVAKYEMKNVNSLPVSEAPGIPWVNIDRDQAIKECRKWKVGGTVYDLISNNQWQAIARNIENVPSNWSGKAVQSGTLNKGHSDNRPSRALAASGDDNKACEGTDDFCSAANWDVQRRTHTLSNDRIIWDFGGNVFEWVRDNFDLKADPIRPTSDGVFNVGDVPLSEKNKALFGSEGGSRQGTGDVCGGSADAVIRGGDWGFEKRYKLWRASGGVFSTVLSYSPNHKEDFIGFRCVFSPLED